MCPGSISCELSCLGGGGSHSAAYGSPAHSLCPDSFCLVRRYDKTLKEIENYLGHPVSAHQHSWHVHWCGRAMKRNRQVGLVGSLRGLGDYCP